MRTRTILLWAAVLPAACGRLPLHEIPTTPSTTASEQPQGSDATNDWIRNRIDSTLKANDVPALSIGIVRAGKVSLLAGFGWQDRSEKKRVSEKTLYQIASQTKMFTGLIVNNLATEGKLNVEDYMVKCLPNGLTHQTKDKLKNITIKDLLHHRAGFPSRAPSDRRVDGDPMVAEYTEQDLLTDLNALELESQPDPRFSYSNFGYAVVGYICEKASRQAYATLVKQYVARRYGLSNTVVYPTGEQLARVAWPYRKDDRAVKSAPWRMGKLTAAGGGYSTAEDLTAVMAEQLKAYRLYEGKGSKSPLVVTEDTNTSWDNCRYGFGFAKSIKPDDTVLYGHGGDLDGYASGYAFSPEKNMGLVLLTSSGGRWFGQLEKAITQKLLQEYRIKHPVASVQDK